MVLSKRLQNHLSLTEPKKVYLAVRNPESTKNLKDQFGDNVVTLQAEVTDAKSITQLAEQAKDVELVANNASMLVPASPLSDDIEEAQILVIIN